MQGWSAEESNMQPSETIMWVGPLPPNETELVIEESEIMTSAGPLPPSEWKPPLYEAVGESVILIGPLPPVEVLRAARV
jgi:hypothetical protein